MVITRQITAPTDKLVYLEAQSLYSAILTPPPHFFYFLLFESFSFAEANVFHAETIVSRAETKVSTGKKRPESKLFHCIKLPCYRIKTEFRQYSYVIIKKSEKSNLVWAEFLNFATKSFFLRFAYSSHTHELYLVRYSRNPNLGVRYWGMLLFLELKERK